MPPQLSSVKSAMQQSMHQMRLAMAMLLLSTACVLPAAAQTATAAAESSSNIATASAEDELTGAIIAGRQIQGTAADSPLAESVREFGSVMHEMTDESDQAAAATSSNSQTLPTSQAQAVTHDKLILNTPVVDAAKILTPAEYMHLTEQLQKINQDKLAQAALVIVPTTEGMDIFDYALAVADRWQLGQADTDDGLLIVVAINDRKLHILTGYGLEGVLPDAVLNRIIREDITPAFKTGAYAQGLSAGIARIDERLRADPESLARADAQAASVGDESVGVDLIGLFIIALIAGSFLGAILGRFLGATIGAGGFVAMAVMGGSSLFLSIIAAVILWVFILARGIALPTFGGGFRTGGRSGGFGGGFGGGGFGSGGFGGGGGSFGGGGAGGSW